ncbi:hypothetical protein SAMN05660874_00459 [Saccharopolyspora flava]|uniref:Uncharacterized protein n=1 Tax=Saccharopolyspora flava TaxID=95161 RepID=A0A1I6P4U6_9PSEU|nr:hypothetical protein SAMN05660874_00459 [Saccharopolyspora flava]
MSLEDGEKLSGFESEPIVEYPRTDGSQRDDVMRRIDSALDEGLGRFARAWERLGEVWSFGKSERWGFGGGSGT